MKFRPCIDIHNGKVKQLVGGTLSDTDDKNIKENFVSDMSAAAYARMYKSDYLTGGHIIILNPAGSEYYDESKQQALDALREYPGGMQFGGGITPENAPEFLDGGASHVIVTSYVFSECKINYENLSAFVNAVGKERLVLDLSCRYRDGAYYIVTDRWQKFTDVEVCGSTLERLSGYCDEFLVHAVDAEGKQAGVDTALARILGAWDGIPISYAGGVGSYEDLTALRKAGNNRLDVTVGSALDIFGGKLEYCKVLEICDLV